MKKPQNEPPLAGSVRRYVWAPRAGWTHFHYMEEAADWAKRYTQAIRMGFK